MLSGGATGDDGASGSCSWTQQAASQTRSQTQDGDSADGDPMAPCAGKNPSRAKQSQTVHKTRRTLAQFDTAIWISQVDSSLWRSRSKGCKLGPKDSNIVRAH